MDFSSYLFLFLVFGLLLFDELGLNGLFDGAAHVDALAIKKLREMRDAFQGNAVATIVVIDDVVWTNQHLECGHGPVDENNKFFIPDFIRLHL